MTDPRDPFPARRARRSGAGSLIASPRLALALAGVAVVLVVAITIVPDLLAPPRPTSTRNNFV